MKRGLSYIVMVVLCGLCLSSCANDELVEKAGGDGRAPVRLTLSLSGNSSRAISPPVGDGELDPTTPEQGAIVEDDVYVLVIDAVTQRLKYLVEDLRVIDGYASQKILEGTMERTTGHEQVRLVVLANLNQNQIQGVTGDMQTYLKTLVGKEVREVYDKLVYNYTGSTPWNLVERRLPMWGISPATGVPPAGQSLECKLYRAVAKVSLWVNGKQGHQDTKGDFTITGITVNNANDKGYCVSQAPLDPDETVQYLTPYVTGLWMNSRNIVYTGLNVTTAYEDLIYLPEQENTDSRAVSLEVTYTYGGETQTKTIEFKKDGVGDRFEVVRNHVYVFNIKVTETPTGGGLKTDVETYVQNWSEIPLTPGYE